MTVSAHASARTILRLSTALCRYLAVPGVHSWEPEGPRLSLSGLRAYQWDYLYHRLGGTKWHNRPDFRGLPEAVSQPNQLQKEVALSPDVSGGTMRTCAEIKGHDNCTFATP